MLYAGYRSLGFNTTMIFDASFASFCFRYDAPHFDWDDLSPHIVSHGRELMTPGDAKL